MDKERFFSGFELKAKPVPLDGFDGMTLVELNGQDMQDYIDYRAAGNSSTAAGAFVVVRSIRENGQRIFDDSEIARFLQLPNSVLGKLVDAVNELNGWVGGDSVKNSDAGLAGDSSSASA